MSPKRGICAECGTEKAVNADGTVRHHLAAGHGRWRGDCPGYGQSPASKAPDPIAAAEVRGYAKAVARLRYGQRIADHAWQANTALPDVSLRVAADFLEAEATKGQS